MAYLDRGISEAYVGPQIEAVLGYSREEWLEDPIRWYQHIHPDDKQRWSLEAADGQLSGKPAALRLPGDLRDGRGSASIATPEMMRHAKTVARGSSTAWPSTFRDLKAAAEMELQQ